MPSSILITIVVSLAIIGSGIYNVWRRKRNLNRVAYAIYCLGCIWATTLIFLNFFRGDEMVLLAWIVAGAIGGAISWRWWRAHRGVAAASPGATDNGPAAANSGPPMLPAWGRAVTLAWLVGCGGIFALGSFSHDFWLIETLAVETAGKCSNGSSCFANTRAGVMFGLLLTAAAASILLFGRTSRLGDAERRIYVAVVVLSPLVMVLYVASAVSDF